MEKYSEKCRVMAITNQKGGVAKTTTAVNLGIGLAKKGKRVLLIDADPQGSLTASLGVAEPDEVDVTITTILSKIINEEPWNKEDGILHHEEGVDFLPANIELSGLEVSLVNVMSRETVLRRYIDEMRGSYDYIIADSMPSLGMITLNVLTAADSVLIPVQAEYLPVKGLQQLLGTIRRVKRQLNPALSIEGILITMMNARTVYGREIAELLREGYGEQVTIYEDAIPASVRAKETSALGISIYEHDPRGKVAAGYTSLVEEAMSRG